MVKVVKTQQDVIISDNYGTGTRTRLTADGYRAIYWSCTNTRQTCFDMQQFTRQYQSALAK